ncbi:hypothetical protein AK812_SmicGene17403 [Symbiodinium microadriaticum]|uniref:Uncharacterized protein n=1 Tax=Symbiodinium microadriaticum TaxID=2951 RepID=A0A1Q9DXU6_SYMMI|nr:hypothetical protein AK812_SmicGene17403 [Symbiodinium microadriaticum]
MSALVEGEGPGHTPACGAPSPEAEPDRPDFSSSFKRALTVQGPCTTAIPAIALIAQKTNSGTAASCETYQIPIVMALALCLSRWWPVMKGKAMALAKGSDESRSGDSNRPLGQGFSRWPMQRLQAAEFKSPLT